MTNNRTTVQLIFICLVVMMSSTVLVHAQSGRRQPAVPSAAPVPTPTPEPTPAPKAEREETDLGFIVGIDESSTFSTFPMSYFDAALGGCTQRLRDGSSVHVSVAGGRGFNRAEANKRAKAEKTTYVVLLVLTGDSMGVQTASANDEVALEFTVFTPVTGKIATSGRSYLNANRKGPLVVPTPGTVNNALYREQLIRRAGEDAADRILKSLHLAAPVINR